MSSLVVIMFALFPFVDDRLLTPAAAAAAAAWFALLLMFDLLVCFARYSSLPPFFPCRILLSSTRFPDFFTAILHLAPFPRVLLALPCSWCSFQRFLSLLGSSTL